MGQEARALPQVTVKPEAPSSPRRITDKEVEVVDLAGSDSESDEAPAEINVPVVSNAEGQNDEDSSGNVANAPAEEEAGDDDASEASTKDYYKDLCDRLITKNEERKRTEHKLKKENRRLKEQLSELENELESLKRQVNAG
jgi:predicted ribosome quality control (RQC) complex YloA/Tae2 family protein